MSSSELGRSGSRSRMNRWSPRCATSYSTSVFRGSTTFQADSGFAASSRRISDVMAEPAVGYTASLCNGLVSHFCQMREAQLHLQPD